MGKKKKPSKVGILCECIGSRTKHWSMDSIYGKQKARTDQNCACVISNRDFKSKRGGKSKILGNNVSVSVTKRPKGSRRALF